MYWYWGNLCSCRKPCRNTHLSLNIYDRYLHTQVDNPPLPYAMDFNVLESTGYSQIQFGFQFPAQFCHTTLFELERVAEFEVESRSKKLIWVLINILSVCIWHLRPVDNDGIKEFRCLLFSMLLFAPTSWFCRLHPKKPYPSIHVLICDKDRGEKKDVSK